MVAVASLPRRRLGPMEERPPGIGYRITGTILPAHGPGHCALVTTDTLRNVSLCLNVTPIEFEANDVPVHRVGLALSASWHF